MMHTSALHSSAEFTPEQVHQIVNGRPIPPQEQTMARQRLEVLKKDKGFVERYLAGDRDGDCKCAWRGLPRKLCRLPGRSMKSRPGKRRTSSANEQDRAAGKPNSSIRRPWRSTRCSKLPLGRTGAARTGCAPLRRCWNTLPGSDPK